jgi:hypothetical protein
MPARLVRAGTFSRRRIEGRATAPFDRAARAETARNRSPAPRNGVTPFLGGLSVLLAIDGLRSVLDPLKGFFRRHRIVEVMQALPILTLVGV